MSWDKYPDNMIFVTAGTQLPFDRLIKAIDEIAVNLNEEIVVQAKKGDYLPCNIKISEYLCATEYADIMNRARLIVAHAGTGTIISALRLGKPVIVMPRRATLGEHRNEHQLATAEIFEKLQYIHVAHDTRQLQSLILDSGIQCLRRLGDKASDSLVASLTEFLLDEYND